MDGESGERVGDELQSVTSPAEFFFMPGWRNETGSWFQRWVDAWRNKRLAILEYCMVGL